MRKRILGLAASAVSTGLLVAVLPSATASADSNGGWTPVTYQPRDYAAGTVCSYELKEEFPTQAVEQHITATYPDGSPLRTDFRGPLIARFTNVATGATVDEDLSGVGTLYNFRDGSSLWSVPDNLGVTIRSGDPYHAQGEYVLSGGSVVWISPTHQIAILHQTKSTDVCAALS